MPRVPRRRSHPAPSCPACGSDRVRLVQRQEPLHEPDVEGDFKYEVTECDECSDDILTFEQAEAHSRAYAAAVARARGTLTPERIFELRMALGWTQPQMEEAFGVGPKAWGRWERGTVAPSGPAARLLWIAENDRLAFHRMVEAHAHRPQRHKKVVGIIARQGIGEPAIGFRTSEPVAHKEGRTGTGTMSSGDGGAV